MTEAEKKLWMLLRGRKQNCKYRRQVPFGLYVADICCMKHRLLIEIDGTIHNQLKEIDAIRDELLGSGGFRIIRIKNDEVIKSSGEVLRRIRNSCNR